jgi:hypothetical protein
MDPDDWMDPESREMHEWFLLIKRCYDEYPDQKELAKLFRERMTPDTMRSIWDRLQELRKSSDYTVACDADEIYDKYKDQVARYLEGRSGG